VQFIYLVLPGRPNLHYCSTPCQNSIPGARCHSLRVLLFLSQPANHSRYVLLCTRATNTTPPTDICHGIALRASGWHLILLCFRGTRYSLDVYFLAMSTCQLDVRRRRLTQPVPFLHGVMNEFRLRLPTRGRAQLLCCFLISTSILLIVRIQEALKTPLCIMSCH